MDFFRDGNNYLFRCSECHFSFLERRLKHVSWISEIHSKRRKKICHFKQTLKIYIQLHAFTHKMDKVVRFCYGYRSESESPLERFFCSLLAVICASVKQRVHANNHSLSRLQVSLCLGNPLQGSLSHLIHCAGQEFCPLFELRKARY